jgi:hypothetical protein
MQCELREEGCSVRRARAAAGRDNQQQKRQQRQQCGKMFAEQFEQTVIDEIQIDIGMLAGRVVAAISVIVSVPIDRGIISPMMIGHGIARVQRRRWLAAIQTQMPVRTADPHYQQGNAQRPHPAFMAVKKCDHAGKFVIGSDVTQAAPSALVVNRVNNTQIAPPVFYDRIGVDAGITRCNL